VYLQLARRALPCTFPSPVSSSEASPACCTTGAAEVAAVSEVAQLYSSADGHGTIVRGKFIHKPGGAFATAAPNRFTIARQLGSPVGPCDVGKGREALAALTHALSLPSVITAPTHALSLPSVIAAPTHALSLPSVIAVAYPLQLKARASPSCPGTANPRTPAPA
jgi:hypothetical protein